MEKIKSENEKHGDKQAVFSALHRKTRAWATCIGEIGHKERIEMAVRTDLAVERMDIGGMMSADSVKTERKELGIDITEIRGSDGHFCTMHLADILRRDRHKFDDGCTVLAQQLELLCPQKNDSCPALVVGLGNRAITPDALGPLCCESVLATRHLVEQDALFEGFRPVSVLATGVLGTTGVESGELLLGLMDRIQPQLILAVDALAARRMGRLMRMVQISDSGITPGSGVGNARFALTAQTLGVPVLSVGVPTVIDTATIAEDIAQQTGQTCEALDDLQVPAVITTRDADREVAEAARLIACGINLFLHPRLTPADVAAFLA